MAKIPSLFDTDDINENTINNLPTISIQKKRPGKTDSPLEKEIRKFNKNLQRPKCCKRDFS